MLQDNKFPNSICPGCLIQLEATKLFMDLIVQGQMKLREMYRNQQELLQRQEKQKMQLQQALQSVNPNTTVQSYTIQTDESGEIQSFIQSKVFSEPVYINIPQLLTFVSTVTKLHKYKLKIIFPDNKNHFLISIIHLQ